MGVGGKNAAEMTAALIKISFGVFHAVECGNLSSAADRSDGSVTERRERVDTDGRATRRRDATVPRGRIQTRTSPHV